MEHCFAALDGKRFLSSDIAQDLPVLTNMHVPTLVRMLNVLQLLVFILSRTFANYLFYSICIALQLHTTSQSEYRLLRLILHWLKTIIAFSHKIPESQTQDRI